MSRHVFKVTRPDGTTAEVEQYAASKAEALPRVRAWVALHWPKSRLEGEPAYEVQLVVREP